MKYKLAVIVTPIGEGGYMARREEIRATATGDTPEDAIRNLREAIDEMVKEYGRNKVKYSPRLVEAVARDLTNTERNLRE